MFSNGIYMLLFSGSYACSAIIQLYFVIFKNYDIDEDFLTTLSFTFIYLTGYFKMHKLKAIRILDVIGLAVMVASALRFGNSSILLALLAGCLFLFHERYYLMNKDQC